MILLFLSQGQPQGVSWSSLTSLRIVFYFILISAMPCQVTLRGERVTCLVLQVLVCFPQPTPAPVPRCSPFLFINKWAEFNSFWSDSNPYFPLPPCEYGGPLEALAQGDIKAVSVLASPLKIPRHNFYEFVWLLKTGLPRLARMITGQEKLITDPKILREGYRQAAP